MTVHMCESTFDGYNASISLLDLMQNGSSCNVDESIDHGNKMLVSPLERQNLTFGGKVRELKQHHHPLTKETKLFAGDVDRLLENDSDAIFRNLSSCSSG